MPAPNVTVGVLSVPGAAGVDPAARPGEGVVLRGVHLVLTDTRHDDRLAAGHRRQPLGDELRLQRSVGLVRVAEREPALPAVQD
jgi:hypothetical protein